MPQLNIVNTNTDYLAPGERLLIDGIVDRVRSSIPEGLFVCLFAALRQTLAVTTCIEPLDLAGLLRAHEFTFWHDIAGIQVTSISPPGGSGSRSRRAVRSKEN